MAPVRCCIIVPIKHRMSKPWGKYFDESAVIQFSALRLKGEIRIMNAMKWSQLKGITIPYGKLTEIRVKGFTKKNKIIIE